MMWSLVQRNLLLYFKNKSRIFFSLLGALIGFFLYLIFLQSTIKMDWTKIPHATKLLDFWLISGVLTITAITTTLNALSQMINDRESRRWNDLSLTDESKLAIQASYLISAIIIGTLMQIVSFVIMTGYFQWADQIHFSLGLVPKLIMIMILSSIIWTAFGSLLLSCVQNVEILGLINTIVSAAAGFFVCVYIPLGLIPKAAQTFVKWTPAPYNAAIYRQILMKSQENQSFKRIPVKILTHFKDYMGIDIKWGTVLDMPRLILITIMFSLVFSVLAMLLIRLHRRYFVK